MTNTLKISKWAISPINYIFGIILSLSFLPTQVFSQVRYETIKVDIKKEFPLKVELNNDISALRIHINQEIYFSEFSIITKNEKINFHIRQSFQDITESHLIVFKEPINSFSITCSENINELEILTQYLKPFEKSINKGRIEISECDKPLVIPSSEWRKGLPAPIQAPVGSKVKHLIVHHSAGSNTNNNYVDVVRNIYVFHTTPAPNGNGWNDIGYNFLIAQDGTVFEGRTGNNSIEGDNVIGAHFCGKNTGTMGICLLGNYNETAVPEIQKKSLIELAAWKMAKEHLLLNTQEISDELKYSISGHRDGCSTECPGENLYSILPKIRDEVLENCAYLKNINSVLGSTPTIFEELKAYPNPSNEFLNIEGANPENIEIYSSNLIKMEVDREKLGEKKANINIKDFPSGLFIIKDSKTKKSVKFYKY